MYTHEKVCDGGGNNICDGAVETAKTAQSELSKGMPTRSAPDLATAIFALARIVGKAVFISFIARMQMPRGNSPKRSP
jgi:hypothetical protein